MHQQDESTTPLALEDWLNKRPSWLRMAAEIVIKNRRMPTEDEIDALTAHCLSEAAKTLKTTSPLLAPGTILGTAGAGALKIDCLKTIRGVNAIGVDATLDLSKGNIVVVYGANGSGKSGYARLIKHICGARAKGHIHRNVFEEKNVTASAQVSITQFNSDKTSSTSSDIEWDINSGPHPKLSAIPVFDSDTALELGDTPSTATHLPRAMRFVGVLIRISELVNERLKNRSANLVSQLPVIPPEHEQSSASVYLKNLKASLSNETIEKACSFSPALLQERLTLESALAQNNPVAAHTKAVADLDNLNKLSESFSELMESLSNERANAILSARKDLIQKRQIATAYTKSFINGLPLKGVGENVWLKLWEAAKAYSIASAYPEHTHPNLNEGARCVLCQQPLESEGKARLASFEQYLNDTLQAEATAAADILNSLTRELPTKIPAAVWQVQCSAIGLNTEQAVQLANEIEARIEALNNMTEISNVPDVSWSIFKEALHQCISQVTAQCNALAVLLDPTGRAQKESRLRELRAQEWLAGQIEAVKADVARLKEIATIKAAIQLTQTNALTIKSNEIGESELAKGFCERFTAELQALGGQSLPVKMNHRAAGKGIYSFYLTLKNTSTLVKNREVLSEGEQRIVALAAFLADATGADREIPIIFDDPISSLDQRYEEAVAKRLIGLAENRQVIIFTHRLSLMVLLGNAVKQRTSIGLPTIDIQIKSIARDGASTGMPSTIDVFSLKPEAGFNQMVSTIGALRKYEVNLKRIALKDACSNFRILVERAVEDHLCSGVINRYRREINTLGKLNRLSAITIDDCANINAMMTKYSAFEHSQPTDAPTWLPEPDELLKDVQAMLAWIKDFDKRAKQAVTPTKPEPSFA